ncbi:5-(carboxyamino)imidazole ribonucleotide synthase [Wenxinia marina]|uniref:N5-carboxyaminoimidazole ribonucleotide synthase n=1 Tax=Wenxinia marina DSM 24838 TaxID=1123501 RepID=A0A0D0PE17_9RHOB|nr:5-(carboxyamino)imidazole ribonucleotide synthase [Wenxinia marina]KIQ69656.1 5-(carboxyamino)imidazole ribonucleotide synthase [Wenxinia marina DSM 24838]GGL60085.1 N5-carboxyaminoimidazole ribonucleotide synthase [Wenxinia marina]
MSDALPPGSAIGILGGGQLGRMLALAAARLGLKVHIYEPAAAPAGDVAWRLTTASYDDEAALRAFAESVDVVTFEFENVPAAALDLIESLRPIRPNRRALATSQDRLSEKEFLQGIGLTVAPFAPVSSRHGLDAALATVGAPAILKTRRLGYDGKGQARLASAADADAAWQAMAGADAILEGFVEFTTEVSVIAARGIDGAVAAYDPGENVHEDGILRTTTVPATLSLSLAADAVLLAGRILNALDYVGVLGVELFVTPRGLVVNEIAPRVHNSGHWTQTGCIIDQFEQHIRAVAGWPLGDGSRHSDVVMENLIGEDMARVPPLAASGAALHLYGKAEVRPGRKTGHVNRITGPAR